jgi:putative transposase
MPQAPPRLRPVFQRYHPPLYFITFNTRGRKKLLASSRVHSRFIEFAESTENRGMGVGRYVIMPDHIHLFVRNNSELELSQWVRLLKRQLSSAIPSPRPHWQRGFFDRLIRRSESYSAKWTYVQQNPVRAKLADTPDDWPWQGEILALQAL